MKKSFDDLSVNNSTYSLHDKYNENVNFEIKEGGGAVVLYDTLI